MMVSAVSNTLIKEVVARPRPLLDPLLIRTDFSFPSGHAMNSVVFFGLVALFSLQLIAQRWQRILVILFSVLIPLLMGVSRVYLGVHHASDVMVGFILGSLIMMGASRIFKKFKLNSRQPGQKDHSV
jgi:undecaprenyl-diphosphatase